MYHGGNNPHSLLWKNDRDAPNTTMQESSFQPAGAQNPMPSESYDFFAPLGEFGQPRQHYHQMRRLHLLIQGWGELIASTTGSSPEIMPVNASDNVTLRWAVRTKGDSGFLFVNNYERVTTLSDKEQVRLAITLNTTGKVLTVPHDTKDAFTVSSGIWFAWPVNIPLLPTNQTAVAAAASAVAADAVPRIISATAQLTTHATLDDGTVVLFFVETVGITAEVSLSLGSGASAATVSDTSGCSASTEGGDTVLRAIKTGTSEFATLAIGGTTVKLVLLPATFADRVFKIADGGRVLIADDGGAAGGLLQTQLLMEEQPSGEIHIRTALDSTKVWACPPLPTSGSTSSAAASSTADGVFQKYTLDTPQPSIPVPTATLVTPAGPARTIPLAPSKKAQEPTMEDWGAAATYSVKLSLPDGACRSVLFHFDLVSF
jgi:hypothetical protein